MPGLVTVCHATLCQRLWGQPLSAGGGGVGIPTPQQQSLAHPLPSAVELHAAPTLLQRAQRGANLFS